MTKFLQFLINELPYQIQARYNIDHGSALLTVVTGVTFSIAFVVFMVVYLVGRSFIRRQ